MYLYYFIVSVLISFVCIVSSFSQSSPGKITGVVLDKSTKSPIEGADITLLNDHDSTVLKGTITDKDGKFLLSDIPAGKYVLRAGITGYGNAHVKGITVSQDKPVIELQPVSLSQGETTTEEILVESDRSQVVFDGDKKIFDVTKNPASQSGSAIDLLKNIPSVSVDADGNVSLRGNSNVKILVDGRPFGMDGQNRSNLLDQIPANSISSIELITNPSSKYEAEGVTGIINIVLKKNKSFGYNGNLSLNAGTRDKYNGSFNLNLKNDKVQVISSYNYSLNNFIITGGSERTNSLSTVANLFTQDNGGRVRGKNHFAKGGLDYFIDLNNTISLTANYNHSDRTRSELYTNKEFDINRNLTSEFTRDYTGNYENTTYDLALNYTLKLKNKGQQLTADAIFTSNKNDEEGLTYETLVFPQNATGEQVMENNLVKDKDFSFQADYVHPLSEDSKFEAGLKTRYRKKDNGYSNMTYDYNLNQYVLNPALSNTFNYNDLVNAVYALYSGKAGIFKYQAGIRAEQTLTKSLLVNNNSEFKNDYIDVFPSGNISANVTKSTELQLSYSRRIRRPGLYELNPFVNTADPNNYFSGNPGLKPEYTDSYEFSAIQFVPTGSITPSLFYRYTKDLISRTRNYIDSNTTLTSMVNYSSSKSYGMELIFNSQPFPFWSLNGSVSYFKTDIDATNISSSYVNEGSTWSGRVSSSLYLPAQFSLQLNYFYSGDILAAQAIVEPFQSFDASLKKDFFDGRVSATFRVSDIFNTLKFRVNINNDPNFREVLERKRDTRVAYLTINYKFGEADKNQTRRRKDSNRENQGNDGLGF